MRFTMLGFSLRYALCPSIKDMEGEHKHCVTMEVQKHSLWMALWM